MGDFWGDVGDNLTAFFGGSTPEKVRANRQRVQSYKDANKPLPSITHDLGNQQAMQIPNRPVVNKPPQSVIDDVVRRNTLRPGEYQSPTRQGNDDIPESTYRDGPPPPSILEMLMGKLSQGYEGTDPSKIDFSSMDNALKTRMDMLNGARDRIRGNADVSDVNLQQMHDAFQRQVQTEDAARYNQIADTQKGNLNMNTQQAVSAMEGSRAKAQAERQAMLQNLGIQDAGAAVDPGATTLNEGIQRVQERNNINQNLAESQRGNNLSYNNTVAQSIGQQGVARRAALQQQLAGLLGKVDMAQSEAQAQDQTQRAQMQAQAQDSGYKRWNDDQNRTLDIFKTLSGEELAREKMANQTSPAATPHGLQSVAADLENSGADPQAAQAGLNALGTILSEGNYLDGANGKDGTMPYDRANVIIQKLRAKGVDPMTATQIGISYANL